MNIADTTVRLAHDGEPVPPGMLEARDNEGRRLFVRAGLFPTPPLSIGAPGAEVDAHELLNAAPHQVKTAAADWLDNLAAALESGDPGNPLATAGLMRPQAARREAEQNGLAREEFRPAVAGVAVMVYAWWALGAAAPRLLPEHLTARPVDADTIFALRAGEHLLRRLVAEDDQKAGAL